MAARIILLELSRQFDTRISRLPQTGRTRSVLRNAVKSVFHLFDEPLHLQLDVDQICAEGQAEQRHENCH